MSVSLIGNPTTNFNGLFPQYSVLSKIVLPVSPDTANTLVVLEFGVNSVEMIGVDADTNFILCTGDFKK